MYIIYNSAPAADTQGFCWGRCGEAEPSQALCASTPDSFLTALNTLVSRLTACALSVIAARCHTPPFVAARHLPPERGKSFLKGRGKSTDGNFLITLKTLAMSLTAWLSLWESCQARQGLTERAHAVSPIAKVSGEIKTFPPRQRLPPRGSWQSRRL